MDFRSRKSVKADHKPPKNKNAIWGMIFLVCWILFSESLPLIGIVSFVLAIVFLVKWFKQAKKAKQNAVAADQTQEIEAQAAAVVQALHQASIDELAESKKKAATPPPAPAEKKPFTEKTYKIAASHYVNNILRMAEDNPDFDLTKKELIEEDRIDERIWQYYFPATKTELIPEPDNPVDKNAIKVIVDGYHVGYIKAGSCAHLLKVIRENRVRGIDCSIGGGRYKMLCEEYDEDKDKEIYTVESGERAYSVTLTVYEDNPTK